jgi:D-tyrosyl-tRNA(Tyr) deacylase
MIGLIQRVSSASVTVDGEVVGAIGRGILVLAAVEPADSDAQAARMAERLLGYRIFPDDAGRMNRSTLDVGGGVLLVPQFTLAADTMRGMRPSFTSAAPPELGRRLFDELVSAVRARYPRPGTVPSGLSPETVGPRARVQSGRFGADMQVALVNDGPVTFWLRAA